LHHEHHIQECFGFVNSDPAGGNRAKDILIKDPLTVLNVTPQSSEEMHWWHATKGRMT
jgi:hypothetical protein